MDMVPSATLYFSRIVPSRASLDSIVSVNLRDILLALSRKPYRRSPSATIQLQAARATDALVRYLKGNQWWNEVLFFYVAMSGQPREMESFIRTEAPRVARNFF
jgi:hypothetical protein